ncbi:hypothetical protein [Rugosimonospora africana]|uniref:Uncharacterized protein n=1 Tax=Rugosimonospora africana TaxID=556532 RepID=A0A8J3VXA9_9ACTN|nr:hypothetical protein [Rugosimonospora africana]GIH21658.1 hypothetical protein Raf01_98300 [Rugosimonospora africana]
MTSSPGRPPHGQGGKAHIRLQPSAYFETPDGVRVSYENSAGLYEVICADCGDNADIPYEQAPDELRKVRGPYQNENLAMRALEQHMGARFR